MGVNVFIYLPFKQFVLGTYSMKDTVLGSSEEKGKNSKKSLTQSLASQGLVCEKRGGKIWPGDKIM